VTLREFMVSRTDGLRCPDLADRHHDGDQCDRRGARQRRPVRLGWADNKIGGDAAPIYFASTGEHTIRIQRREDGISIDQIVLSRDGFLTTAPGFAKDDGAILQESGGSAD
jgi:hypothetical protein